MKAENTQPGREWCPDCTSTLTRMVKASYTDVEIARHLAALGYHFKPKTIQQHRLALGYSTIRRNTWAGPLRRWRERFKLTKRVPLMS